MAGLVIFGFVVLCLLAAAAAITCVACLVSGSDKMDGDTILVLGILTAIALAALVGLGRWSATLWP